MNKLWCLEYSLSQNAFHRETLAEVVEKNLRNLLTKGYTPDYVIVACAESNEELDIYAKEIKPLLRPEKTND